MASKPVPAKKKPTTAADDSQETPRTTITTASCPNILRAATIGYEVSADANGALWIGLIRVLTS
jgi:hypothetical protein